jgi:hypothetical protein
MLLLISLYWPVGLIGTRSDHKALTNACTQTVNLYTSIRRKRNLAARVAQELRKGFHVVAQPLMLADAMHFAMANEPIAGPFQPLSQELAKISALWRENDTHGKKAIGFDRS